MPRRLRSPRRRQLDGSPRRCAVHPQRHADRHAAMLCHHGTRRRSRERAAARRAERVRSLLEEQREAQAAPHAALKLPDHHREQTRQPRHHKGAVACQDEFEDQAAPAGSEG